MKILVTDGENRSALAVTRALGRKGYDVIVTGATTRNIAASSRYCKSSYAIPNPMIEGKRFSEEIAKIAASEKIDVIFPMTEQSIFRLNTIRDQLSKNHVLACPLPEPMEEVSNKYRLFKKAQSIGVPIPETIFVDGCEDFPSKEKDVVTFPVVVKPAYSKIPDGEGLVSTGVMYAADRLELRKLYETKSVLRHPSLIQEMIIGDGTGLFTLFDIDRHKALFSHRRLLEKPPSGGVSVISESIQLDPEMVESARKLLGGVGWKGVAMVEFKRDVRDGKAKLMEINGRFWGSLQLAVSAGVDFPSLYLEYCLNRRQEELLRDYRIGLRMKWFFGVLDHLIIRLKGRDRSEDLPVNLPARWQVAMDLFRCGNADNTFDVFEFRDLNPFFLETKTYIRNIFRNH